MIQSPESTGETTFAFQRQQPANLLRAAGQHVGSAPGQFPGRHRLFQGGEERRYTQRPHLGGVRPRRAADGDDRQAQFPRDPGHARRRFAEKGLAIETAFTGDDEIAAGQFARQIDALGDEVRARSQARAEKGRESRPQPARRAGPREVRHFKAQIPLDDNFPDVPAKGGANQIAGAAGTGQQRVALVGLEQLCS